MSSAATLAHVAVIFFMGTFIGALAMPGRVRAPRTGCCPCRNFSKNFR